MEEWQRMTGIAHLQPTNLPGQFSVSVPYQFMDPPPTPASDPLQSRFGSSRWVLRF